MKRKSTGLLGTLACPGRSWLRILHPESIRKWKNWVEWEEKSAQNSWLPGRGRNITLFSPDRHGLCSYAWHITSTIWERKKRERTMQSSSHAQMNLRRTQTNYRNFSRGGAFILHVLIDCILIFDDKKNDTKQIECVPRNRGLYLPTLYLKRISSFASSCDARILNSSLVV